MPVSKMLKRRNFRVQSANPQDHLIFAPSLDPASLGQFYQLMHHYGFRTFLKDVILHKEGFDISDLIRYCEIKSARKYLQELIQLKIAIPQQEGKYHLDRSDKILSLGDTLEWYLARLIQEELKCDALWKVVLVGLPSGGDFDVLAECEGSLIYVETKSGPPKSIELENVRGFLKRVNDLRPHLAIFLEDTTLRMKDKIVPHFEEILASDFPESTAQEKTFKRIEGETFRWGDIFITNAKPGILENIRFCIGEFLKGQGIRLNLKGGAGRV